MNVRIKELAEQSGINIDSFQFSGTPIKYIVGESSLEKFAELIVRECIDKVDIKNELVSEVVFQTLELAKRRIKEHFGVK